MKILLINSRYVYIGGPERYLFNLRDILESNGDSVVPFSIKYRQNEATEYDQFFVSAIDDEAILYKDQRWTPGTIYRTLERNFYSGEVERKLCALIDHVKPDFAIVLLYLKKLSPAVLVALTKRKVPFVVRLSDYGMVCPSHNLFRGNQVCELCAGGNIIHSVRYSCVQNSLGASLVNYAATRYHRRMGYFDLIRRFIVPSNALITKMVENGWDSSRFSYLPTFAQLPQASPDLQPQRQILYAGRIEHIKGIHVLIDALRRLNAGGKDPVKLKIAGSGDPVYTQGLRDYCTTHDLAVEFMGDLPRELLMNQYRESMISVIPSLCYDNLPNSALESLAVGTPVIAPAHGSFPEFIKDGENGFLFAPANALDLFGKLDSFFNGSIDHVSIRKQSADSVALNYSASRHYERLMEIADAVIKESRSA